MRIEMLSIPECPNGTVSVERVRIAVVETGRSDATAEESIVSDVKGTETVELHGSPTIPIDGRDSFASYDTVSSMSFRSSHTPNGPLGCPTMADLAEVIRAHDR
jgi:hypothetical protein